MSCSFIYHLTWKNNLPVENLELGYLVIRLVYLSSDDFQGRQGRQEGALL
jgi:hypothetical protein